MLTMISVARFGRSFVMLVVMASGVVGCTKNLSFTKDLTVTPVPTEPDIVSVKLSQAADKAAKALDVIASIDQAKNPATPPMEDYTNVPAHLTRVLSLRWSGPIEQAGKILADQAGMRFRVKGAEPAAPLVVNIDVYQQPIIHVLRNVGLQAGRRADLVVDAPSGVIELRYAAADVNEAGSRTSFDSSTSFGRGGASPSSFGGAGRGASPLGVLTLPNGSRDEIK